MHPIWSGTISFGLIHIPIRLYSASKDRVLSFHFLRKGDLCPIQYHKVCKYTGQEVALKDIVKGYEYRKGDYVILEDSDFKKASPKKTQTVEIEQFISLDEVGHELFETPYYLQPTKAAEKAYVLLRDALKHSKKAGIGTFVLRNKELLVVLMPQGKFLMLNTLRYQNELRETKELNIPEKKEYSKKELDMAIQLIDQMVEPFKLSKYKDTYQQELKKLIEKKAAGKTFKPKEGPAFEADVTDIMAKLKMSLEKAQRKR